MTLEMVEGCQHTASDMDAAANADGLCPICLAETVKDLRRRVTVLERVIYEEMHPADCCDAANAMIVEDIYNRADA